MSERSVSSGVPDYWYRWVMEGQYGKDKDFVERLRGVQGRVVNRVLDNGRVGEGKTLLDVGSGDGLVGFLAAERVGVTGKVIFSDISPGLVEVCRAKVEERSIPCAAEFLQAAVEDLGGIADGTVDVVTSRSVLMYSGDKPKAFGEIFRVLRGGGIYSGFEPINRFGVDEEGWGELFYMGFDFSEIAELAEPVLREIHPLSRAVMLREDPVMNYDERDLLRILKGAGFGFIRLEYEATITPPTTPQMQWEYVYCIPQNPMIPSLEEAARRALSAEKRQVFVEYARNLVETLTPSFRRAFSYLVGVKPMRS